ncbi:MAG: hypothetical protein ACKOZM_08015 [Flavobacteriales bacterium]
MILSGICLLDASVRAQGEVEALRYSGPDAGWSARSMGMAGAYSSIGADISSFYTNPAGLAVYKRSTLDLAFSHDNHNTETNYNGENHKDLKSRIALANAAFVATRKPRSARILNISYGLAYAKTNNYYQDLTIEGKATSSLMQQFAWQAQGIEQDQLYNTLPFSAGLAYNVYGIDPDPNDPSGLTYIAATEGECTQHKRMVRKGRQNETTAGIAMQYGENLYIGVSAGLTGIYFSELSTYSEKYPNENRIKSWSYDEDLSTFGTGLVARLGGIYRLHEKVKVSAAYQTKTITYLQDDYSTSAFSEVDTSEYNSASPDLIADYILSSPSQWTLGASAIIGKMGMVSLDWGRSDYRQIRMEGIDDNEYDYQAENALFDTLFRTSNQLRIGLEGRIHSSYYARAGYSIQQSPLSATSGSINSPTLGWTVGVGYRDDHLFADLVLSSKMAKSNYYLYDPALVNAAVIRDRVVRVMLSVGVRF